MPDESEAFETAYQRDLRDAQQADIDRFELEQDNGDGVDTGPDGWEP